MVIEREHTIFIPGAEIIIIFFSPEEWIFIQTWKGSSEELQRAKEQEITIQVILWF